MSSTVERKLAAIMCTDIADFTSIASQDESEALCLLESQRKIIVPIIKSYNGILHKELGDGLLITFNLTSEAVECGIKIQKTLIDIEKLNLRIAIHEGEISIRDDDVLGDDINLAFRIEPFSAIGGIAISGKVQQNISSNPDYTVELVATPMLKGIKNQIDIFALTAYNLPIPDKSLVNAKLATRDNKSKLSILTAVGITVCLLFTVYSKGYHNTNVKQASIISFMSHNPEYEDKHREYVEEIINLLSNKNLDSNDKAYDLVSELVLLDDSIPDYKALMAQAIFQRATLMDNNEGLLEKSMSIASEIIELDFIDDRHKSYSYFILSKVEYINENKNIAVKHIKKAFFISRADIEIKEFWKKLNREQLKGWES